MFTTPPGSQPIKPSEAEPAGSLARDIAALLTQVGNGDRAAFKQVYEMTSARLLGVVLRVNTHRGEAEEVLQDVYVSVWHLAGQYRPVRGDAFAWLVSVARNRAIDSVRLRQRRPQAASSGATENAADGPYDGLACNRPGPHEQCSAASDAAALSACLGGLSPPQRHSLVLAYCDGLSHTEIAQRLGRPVGTVKSWVRRGLRELRERFDAHAANGAIDPPQAQGHAAITCATAAVSFLA